MVKDAEVYESGNWYMYDADGRMVTNREIPVRVSTGRTKLVRYDADGKMHKGVYTENGKRYFYDKVTGGRVSGVWRMLNEDGQGTRWVYYSTADGTMQFGEQYLNYDREHTGWYYFDTCTGKMAHGVIWVNSSGGKWVYYHIKNGKMQYGQQYLNYDREHTGWYYFDTCTGKMAHGFTSLPASGKDAAKTVYYHAQSGKMQYGGHLINNRPYYFDKNTGRKYSGTEVVNTLVRTARNYCHSNLNASNALVSAGGIFCPKGPCMSFVWCVYHYSGMDVFLANGTSAAGQPSGYPDDYYNWYARNGRLTRTPRVGDIAFFYFSSGAGWATNASHAALVVGVNGSKVTVIDAAFYNIAERVASNSGGTYPLPKAYGHPDFQ
ncbi:Surface protective antigen SpaA [Bifidobacterium pseudolongum subsp. globosum]|nr:Surface protective antigen SpaA [Bifidobacterium pseudolongum subsp. globosum]